MFHIIMCTQYVTLHSQVSEALMSELFLTYMFQWMKTTKLHGDIEQTKRIEINHWQLIRSTDLFLIEFTHLPLRRCILLFHQQQTLKRLYHLLATFRGRWTTVTVCCHRGDNVTLRPLCVVLNGVHTWGYRLLSFEIKLREMCLLTFLGNCMW